MALDHCWEIKKCGRQKVGNKVDEFGECIASRAGLGHFCWAIAGTLCDGAVQGTIAQKEGDCRVCEVYDMYNPVHGTRKNEMLMHHPEEYQQYMELVHSRNPRVSASCQ